jgi:hypothetical protein
VNLGNQLNQIVNDGRRSLFDQGELAQLTYGAFDIAATALQSNSQDEIQVTFPVGYRPNRTAIESVRTYRKDQLLLKYQFLAYHQLTVNALVQLVVIVETMLSDVLRAVVLRYPQKLGSKRTVPLQVVFECTNVEDLHLRAGDSLLNELAYKSPTEFAESFQQLISVNPLECPAFHRYIEIKATRDIFVHNRGIANDVYIRKAGSHARARPGSQLPADLQYFLESYEHCLQIADWLEVELHSHWHSSEYEDRKQSQAELPFTEAKLPEDPNANAGADAPK